MKTKLDRQELSWIFYDIGNSAFVLMVSTVFPIYFNYLSEQVGLSTVSYLAYWGYAASIVTIVVALIGPVLGTIADGKSRKKPLFTMFVMIGVLGCAALGLCHSWIGFLVIFIIAKVGFNASLIFYDSMLGDVTTPERVDEISSLGYAWGYIGSCIPFAVSLLIILRRDSIGLSMGTAMLIAFVLAAIWWIVMTLPLLKNYRQIHYVEVENHAIINSFKRLGQTLENMNQDRKVFLFLLAYFFYIDGVYTIIDMATAYGTALGLNTTGLLLALLMTQIVAFPAAIVFGKMSHKYPAEKLILVCIIAYTGITVFAIFINSQVHFWILAFAVGLFQGGVQALSRSYFSKIIPAEKSGEYFGILDICGKGASFLGTTLVSIVSQITGNESAGISILVVLFAIGAVCFVMSVKDKRGRIDFVRQTEGMHMEKQDQMI